MTNYPFGDTLSLHAGQGDTVRIVNAASPVNAGLDDAGLSGWNTSDHTEFTGIGSFYGVTDNGTNGYWVTIIRNVGSGYIVYSGQDVSYHIQNGLGPTGAGSPKGVLLNNILSLVAPTGVTQIAAGDFYSLFLTSDGSLWGMGDGQAFGNTYSLPQQIVASNVTAIAAGWAHFLFIERDGSLWGMGFNQQGQLGDGTVNSTYQPEKIVASNVVAIAAGKSHSLFVKSDGSPWAMGDNTFGAMGDGTYSRTNRPEQIVASGVTAVTAGEFDSLFIKSDGSLWGMGWNQYGELGDGTTDGGTYRTNRPEQIVDSGVTAVSGGYTHTLFIKSDGSLWGMGDRKSTRLNSSH